MIYIVLNAVPILLGTLAGLAAGWLVQHFASGEGTRLPIVAFLVQAWFAAILAGALILAPPRADPWIMAVASAVVIWIGFVVPALTVSLRQRGQGGYAIATEATYWLVVMLVQAVVMKLVGLVPPPM